MADDEAAKKYASFIKAKDQYTVGAGLVDEAATFYKNTFGALDNGSYRPTYVPSAGLNLGASTIVLCDATSGSLASTSTAVVETVDIESAVERAVANGAEIRQNVSEIVCPGGFTRKVARVTDPFGFTWLLASPMNTMVVMENPCRFCPLPDHVPALCSEMERWRNVQDLGFVNFAGAEDEDMHERVYQCSEMLDTLRQSSSALDALKAEAESLHGETFTSHYILPGLIDELKRMNHSREGIAISVCIHPQIVDAPFNQSLHELSEKFNHIVGGLTSIAARPPELWVDLGHAREEIATFFRQILKRMRILREDKGVNEGVTHADEVAMRELIGHEIKFWRGMEQL